MYEAKTRSISVTVTPQYLPEQSEPEDGRYFWAYHVVIANHGEETVQLLNRHWKITDSLGRTEEVHGPGVVGEQPVIKPGEAFDYTSGCPLQTSSGIMVGSYEMIRGDGERFDVEIPAFSLDLPGAGGQVN